MLRPDEQAAEKRAQAATKIIRERLLLARREQGLTQTTLGAALDPSRSHAAISDMERGITKIAAIDLAQVAAITNRPTTWFYGESSQCKEGWICEGHPSIGWPHGDCPGPGMPCPLLLERLKEARAELKAAKRVLEMDDPRLLKAVKTIERVLRERDEMRGKLEAVAELADRWRTNGSLGDRELMGKRVLRILRCICGGPSTHPCGPACKYPYADVSPKEGE